MKYAGKEHFDYIDQKLRKDYEQLNADIAYQKTRTVESIEAGQRFVNKGVREIKVTKASAASFTIVKQRIGEIFKQKKENLEHVIKSINEVLEKLEKNQKALMQKGYVSRGESLISEKKELESCRTRIEEQIEKISSSLKEKLLEVRGQIEKAERMKAYKKIKRKF